MKSLVILTLALKFSKQKLQEHLLIFVSVNFRNHKPALLHQDLNQKIAFLGTIWLKNLLDLSFHWLSWYMIAYGFENTVISYEKSRCPSSLAR